MNDSKSSVTAYSKIARLLHWSTAVLVVGLFTLGLWMDSLSYYHPWYQRAPSLHMSFGILLFFIVLLRLLYRTFTSYPAPLATHSNIERLLARMVHWLLYGGLAGMILSGYFIATADGEGISVFGVFELPALFDSLEAIEDQAADVHELLAFFIIGLAGMHGLAALKNHFIDKDLTLRRMTFLSKKSTRNN